MRVRSVLLLIGALLLAVFAAANWSQFTQPVTLDLIVQEYEAPFGLAMLGVVVVFGVLFLLSIGGVEVGALRRKLAASKEVETAHRVLAEKDANQISQLETAVREKLEALDGKLDRILAELRDREAVPHH